MRRLPIAPIAAASLAAILFLPADASFAATDVSHVKGLGASASWDTTDSTGCIQTDAFVIAFENRSTDPNGSFGPAADVGVFQFDACRGVQVLAAEGFVDLAAGAFRANPALQSATLSVDVQLVDELSSATLPAHVEIAWTGVGEVIREVTREHQRFPGGIFLMRTDDRRRDAQATGTFLVGDTDYATGTSTSAALTAMRSGTLSHSR